MRDGEMHQLWNSKHHENEWRRMDPGFEGVNTRNGDTKYKVECESLAHFGLMDEPGQKFGVEPVASPNDVNCSVETATTFFHQDIQSYKVGDLVWAKVKSYPWWPGQVFNVVHASGQARSLEKPGRILVAFYGDHTFAWLEQSQILEFEPNFERKAKVTNSRIFQCAISEALNEVCRRAQLGLRCQCHNSLLDSKHNSSDFDDGVQGTHEGLRQHKDVSTSMKTLNGRRTLSFLKDLASSPRTPCSSVDVSVLHGHLLGIRTGILGYACKDEMLEEGQFTSTRKDERSEEVVFDSTARAIFATGEVQSQVECRKCGNAGYKKRIFPLEDCERAKRHHVGIVDTEEKERASNLKGAAGQKSAYGMIGFCNKPIDQQDNASREQSREHIRFSRARREVRGLYRDRTASLNKLARFCDDKTTDSLMQISETLQFVAIDPLGHHGSYEMMAANMALFLKFRDLIFQKSAGYGCHLRSPGQKETQMNDAPHISISAGEHDIPNPVPRVARRYWRPMIQKQRTLDPRHNQVENLEALNSSEDPTYLQCVAQEVSPDKEGMVLGMNFESPSQANSQMRETVRLQKHDVQELLMEAHTKTSDIIIEACAKLDVHELLIGAHKRKSDFTKETTLKLDVHELLLEAQKKNFKCLEEVPAPVKVSKQDSETRSLKGSDEDCSVDASRSAFVGEVFLEANADGELLADHFSRAYTGRGISVEHFSEDGSWC